MPLILLTFSRQNIPCAMVYGLYVLFLECRALIATVARKIVCELDPSVGGSGPHAFAVRVSALRLSVSTRPSHPAPRFVTIAIALRWKRGTGCRPSFFPKNGRRILFSAGRDTISENQPDGQISGPALSRGHPSIGLCPLLRMRSLACSTLTNGSPFAASVDAPSGAGTLSRFVVRANLPATNSFASVLALRKQRPPNFHGRIGYAD